MNWGGWRFSTSREVGMAGRGGGEEWWAARVQREADTA